MTFPILANKRLQLNALTQADAAGLFKLFSQDAVVRFYDIARFQKSSQAEKLLQFFQQRWQEKSGIRWGVRLQGTSELIGTCGFNTWNSKSLSAGIGYELSPDFWGKGIATEAISLMIKAAFDEQLPFGKLHRIQADVVPGNTASEKLLLKLGFKEEGIRRDAGFWNQQFHDLKCFGLIQPEFKSAVTT